MNDPVWWLSWWDPPNGAKGKRHPTGAVAVWVTGYRDLDFRNCETSICARVEAPTEEAAWEAVDVEYPGASQAERRFAHERAPGWWPPADRCPRKTPAPPLGETEEGTT